MDALLGLGPSSPQCGSVAEVQDHLRSLLSARVTETHADHISQNFEIRATVVFDIPTTNDGDPSENTSNIDPLLATPAPTAAQANGGPAPAPTQTKRIQAIDALTNQPSDNPALQTSVARHIILAVGQVDGSNWSVRQVSRSEQGWTFTYICKDSRQAWDRQVAKNPPKIGIAEWSEKGGQDPVHLGMSGLTGCVHVGSSEGLGFLADQVHSPPSTSRI
jgi:hypothetical protein